MKRRTANTMLIAALLASTLALAAAAFSIVTEPVLALTWWVVATASSIASFRSINGGAAIGTIITIGALAVYALRGFGVPMPVAIGLAVVVAAIVVVYLMVALKIAGSADYPFED
jgi:hypothetical protein